LKYKYGKDSLTGAKVAVQGLGNVGFRLCDYLNTAGAKLIVTDIDGDKTKAVAEQFDAVVADADEIHRADVDIFSPCALGAVINDQTLPEIKASIIAGSANNQLARLHHGDELMARNVLYAPDYVVNAGGLIDISSASKDYDADKILDRVSGIYDRLLEIFARSSAEGLATMTVSDRMAEEKFMRPLATCSEAA